MKKQMRLSIVIILISTGYSASAQTVKMAIFQLEPFMMEDSRTGEITGTAVEYWKQYIAPKLGVDLEIVGLFPALRTINMLKTGKVDVIPLLTKIPERAAVFQYPESILTRIICCMIVPVNSNYSDPFILEEYYGKTIAFLESAFIPDLLIDDRITFEMVPNQNYRMINLKKLIVGRVDAELDINYISLLYYLDQNPFFKDKVRIIMLPVENEPVYSVFRDTEEGRELQKAYDIVNKQGLAEGIFAKMTEEILNQGNDMGF